jgi:hypothetical protein
MRIFFLAVGTVLLLVGCRSSTATESVILDVGTDGATFSSGSSIEFTVSNPSQSDAYVAACGPQLSVSVERQQEGDWVLYSEPLCQAVYPISPILVGPGAVIRGALSIDAPGRYRFRVLAAARPEDELRVGFTSNPFTVE